MSADKRTVSTDALETLGMIHTRDEKRDAIHLAVIPVTAGANIDPGNDVCLDREGLAVTWYEGESTSEPLGIADPFIRPKEYGAIKPGQRFWLVIYPRKITSLRHVWTHPAFDDESLQKTSAANDAREESRRWLDEYARKLFSYQPDEEMGTRLDVLLACAEDGAFGTDIEGEGRTPTEEFWMHFERYMGRKAKNRPDWFRCAC